MRQKLTETVLSLDGTSLSDLIRDVTLQVAAGEIVTLLGRPAAAILQAVAGFTRPSGGTITLSGSALSRTPPHRRNIGFVASETRLFPHLDVTAHARFASDVSATRAQSVLQRLGIGALARHMPPDLTQDQRVRTALARALGREPRLLLLDDPMAGLSPSAQAALKAVLRDIAREDGVAMLHATPEAAHSFGLSDRIGVLEAGRLRQIATPEDIYDNPASLAVAQTMGPLNTLEGHVVEIDDDTARIRITGGTIVEARLGDTLQKGSPCVIAIRPERVAVAAVAADDMGEAAIAVRLIETVFLGDHTRLRFSIGPSDGADLWVIRPAGVAPPRGNAISLAWQAHHAHAFARAPI
jgi:putative spermidine/putrescine transport system ATP-binding protein